MNKSPNISPLKQLVKPTFGEFYDHKPSEESLGKPLPNLDTFEQLLQFMKTTNRKYVDLEFPPNFKHLVHEKNSIHTYDWAGFVWNRPDKFYKDPKMFAVSMRNSFAKRARPVKDISKSDILQGALGNCYLLAALCCLAELNDGHIRKLFITQETNQYGLYCVQICFNGEWRAVIVDDFFPCYNDARGPCFSKGNNEELWVMILEKAWAKLHGCYERIEAGLASESLRSLTGAPVELFFQDDNKIDLWKVMKEAFKNKFPMCTAVDDEENLSKSKIGKKNLVPAHVYTLLSVTEIHHPIRGEQRLIKLRNPWGNKEWKGDWSDESTVWTEELQKKLNHETKNDDGTFFIEFKDFREAFSEVAVCYYHPDYKHSSQVFKPTKKANYFNVKVDRPGEYYISVLQVTGKLLSDNDLEVKYATTRLMLAKQEPNGNLRFVGAKQKADQAMFLQIQNLEPGNYVIYLKVINPPANPSGKGENDVTLSFYGVDKISVKTAGKSKGFVEKCLLSKAYVSAKKSNYREIGRADVEKAFELFDEEGFGYFFIANKGNKKFSSKVIFQKKDGLKLREVKGGDNTFDFDLAPNTEKILTVGVDYSGYSMKYTESLTY